MDVVAQDALANDETLALAHLSRGRLDEAFALFSEVREGLFEMGPAVPWIDGWTLPFLAHVAEVIGDMETATELVEQMLARPRTLCHWGGVLVGAAVRRRTGDLEGAGELLTEAEQRAPVLGHSWLGSWLHSERGLLALALGQDPLPHLDRCRENIEELGDLMDHALPLVRLRVLEEAVSAAR